MFVCPLYGAGMSNIRNKNISILIHISLYDTDEDPKVETSLSYLNSWQIKTDNS